MTDSTENAARHTNRLAREKSPYLLQHQHNPVDWYAWGEEAFAKARAEDKPIFLSVGYSTCHWCHVMERESFENEEVGRVLNEHFVSIKVDREERPDVDKIYMTFVQATTGHGGWPMSVFLTPELKPFMGGTYFPPENQQGRPGFLSLIRQLAEIWKNRQPDIAKSAEEIQSRLAQATTLAGDSELELEPEQIQSGGMVFKRTYDRLHGGFGRAPKFPQPSTPQFMLVYARRCDDPEAVQMVLDTCDRMAAGGIHDQLGGGFSRYSVDAQWLVPHFEKMLYDNAQLAQLYLDAFVLTGEPRHAGVARDILDYVLRDMTHPDGGFYSAEDADSEGQEGKFYCWTLDELSALLTPEEYNVAVRYYGLKPEGNFIDHSHPEPLKNLNVLSVVDPEIAEADQPLLRSAQEKMRAQRATRVRPHLDDKVLTSWNGLMLGAFARASAVLDEPRYLRAGERNFSFLKEKLWEESSQTLYHRWRDGQRDQVQLLEAYAYLLLGVVDFYEAVLRPELLEFAVRLADSMVKKFYDPENGGFWQSPAGSADLILRLKEDYDGAEPAGNSVAVLSLLKLAKITGRDDFAEAAETSLQFFSERLSQLPQAVPFMLLALDFYLHEPRRVVIAGAASPEIIHAVHSVYEPGKVVLGTSGPVEPFATTLPSDQTMVYLCTGTFCQAPTNDPQKVKEMLATKEK